MNPDLSIAQVLADLESQIAAHAEQETFHAGQETFHRSQRELHEGELARLKQCYEGFRTAAQAAGKEVRQGSDLRPAQVGADAGQRSTLSKLVASLIQQKAADERFGPTALAQEINDRYAKRLRNPARPRSVSVTLRRLLAEGRVHVVEEGRAFHEAVYTRAAR